MKKAPVFAAAAVFLGLALLPNAFKKAADHVVQRVTGRALTPPAEIIKMAQDHDATPCVYVKKLGPALVAVGEGYVNAAKSPFENKMTYGIYLAGKKMGTFELANDFEVSHIATAFVDDRHVSSDQPGYNKILDTLGEATEICKRPQEVRDDISASTYRYQKWDGAK